MTRRLLCLLLASCLALPEASTPAPAVAALARDMPQEWNLHQSYPWLPPLLDPRRS